MYDVTENKRSEARLRKSEHRHRALVEQSSDGILTFEPDSGRVAEANKQFCGMIGYSAEELLRMSVYDLVEEDRNTIERYIRKATEKTYALVGLQKYRRKDGTQLNVEVSLAHVNVNVDGERLIMASMRDVTAFKKIEAEIRRQELFLRTMTQSSPLAYFVVDNRTDKIVYLNTNFCDIWCIRHLEEDMRLGRLSYNDVMSHCLMLVTNADEFAESCRPLQEECNRSVVEDEIAFVDGRIIRRFSKQIRDSGDKYYGRLYIYEDVTQRKQMEQVLRHNEEIYRQLFLNSPAIKIVVDPESAEILDVNQAAIDYYGYCADEIRGMSIYDINVSGQAIVSNHMQSVRDACGDYFQFRHRLKSGEVREVEVFSGLINISGKKIITSIVVDITARRQAERMLQSAYELRRRSDFINDIINENIPTDEKVIPALRALGIDISAPLICCLITFDKLSAGQDSGSNAACDVHIMQNSLIETLNDKQGRVAWECRGQIGIICQPKDEENADSVACCLMEDIRRFSSQLAVRIGVGSSRTGAGSIVKSYREAWSALVSAHCREVCERRIIHYCDLGAFQLLAGIGGKEQVNEFVENNIGKLIKYDQERGTDYLLTLDEILRNDNMKEAAARMFLHPKTMVFRRQRIEKILGINIDRFETKLALAMAVKLHNLHQYSL